MKKSFLFAGCIAASMMFAACGDDSSSDSNNVDRETSLNDESSSSVEEESSSSEEESSSSVEETPGIRPATLDDFEKNMVLKGLFGTDIAFTTGSKTGLFTMWLTGEIQDSAWLVIHSDFNNGVLDISTKNSSFAAIPGNGTIDSLSSMLSSSAKISFIVDETGEEPALRYVLDGDTSDVETSKIKVSGNIVSSGDSLVEKRFVCKGDTVNVYSFYDGAFLMQRVVGSDTVDWVAGYSDIQRNKLLMFTQFFYHKANAIYTAEVSSSNTLKFTTGLSLSCEAESFKYTAISSEDMATEWDALENDVDWSMNLKSNGSFKVVASSGSVDVREGTWGIFGDNLFMKNSVCVDTKCEGIMGRILDFDAKTGFTYNHTATYPDDGETHLPELPTEWTVPQYE